MIRMATRFLLLRFLPRRILPIVTIAEALLLLRSVRRRNRVGVNEPIDSRTAPPPTPAVRRVP
ncbi:MAG TPA: hypothetical protein VFY18_02135 [Candidatus Limnocylindrales bacterium]|nr:hypothetical protein [Candidatus Limnocylindrales bacterium]